MIINAKKLDDVADRRNGHKGYTVYWVYMVSWVIKLNKLCKLYALCSLLIVLLFCLPLSLQAKVTGYCSNCHTMHNSQGGSATSVDRGTYGTPPYINLLRDTCFGCHAATDGNTWKDAITGAPIVFNAVAPQYGGSSDGVTHQGLAGGNFYWVATAGGNDPTKGHNVWGISVQDPNLSAAPGRPFVCGCHETLAKNPADQPLYTGLTRHQSGCEGCHLHVTHHQDTGIYRFLCGKNYPTDPSKGVRGQGDTNWEQNPTPSTHNTYIGKEYAKSYTTAGNGDINALCAACHYSFLINAAGPWLMHPTNVVIPNSGEFTAYTVYDPISPVGRPEGNFPADPSVVRLGTDLVTCVTCHRVHGSPYFKMLRWDYKNSSISTALKQCNLCHSNKN